MGSVKYIAICLAFITTGLFPAFGGIIVLEGYYQNQNIYVQNSFSSSGVGFCTYEVTINGEVSTDEINSNAFEIDLVPHQIKIGAPVEIRIKYKDDGCFPTVLNPSALKPNPTFETIDVNVDNKGILKWTTINEKTSHFKISPCLSERFFLH